MTKTTLKTDNHFRLYLDRENRKNLELKGIVAKLHNKIKEVNCYIDKTIN
jgi:hypothetical protein